MDVNERASVADAVGFRDFESRHAANLVTPRDWGKSVENVD